MFKEGVDFPEAVIDGLLLLIKHDLNNTVALVYVLDQGPVLLAVGKRVGLLSGGVLWMGLSWAVHGCEKTLLQNHQLTNVFG